MSLNLRAKSWVLLPLLFTVLSAQKAKPLQIFLNDGGATVEGRLQDSQTTHYEISVDDARSKVITLELKATPNKTVGLKLYSPENAEMPLQPGEPQPGEPNRWTAILPKSGDYGIAVLRTSVKQGTSTYWLRITVR